MSEHEEAKAQRIVALMHLKEGLSPVEIQEHMKNKGESEQKAYDVSIAAEHEVGHPRGKMDRKTRREWQRHFEEIAKK